MLSEAQIEREREIRKEANIGYQKTRFYCRYCSSLEHEETSCPEMNKERMKHSYCDFCKERGHNPITQECSRLRDYARR